METPTHGRPRFCRAHTSAGAPCRKRPIRGALVCGSHGGSAPQVKRAARDRLWEMADPAAARLVKLIDSPDENVALRACIALLDRTGHGPSSTQVNLDGGVARYAIDGVDLEQL